MYVICERKTWSINTKSFKSREKKFFLYIVSCLKYFLFFIFFYRENMTKMCVNRFKMAFCCFCEGSVMLCKNLNNQNNMQKNIIYAVWLFVPTFNIIV